MSYTEVDLSEFEGIEEEIVVDTGETAISYLIISKSGSQIKVSASTRYLLLLVAREIEVDEIARIVSQTSKTSISVSDLDAKLKEILAKIKKIELATSRRSLPAGFWLRLRILPQSLVVWASRRLLWMFNPWVASILVLGIAAGLVMLFRDGVGMEGGGTSFWPAYGLFFLSLIFHELGHASACLRYGAQPSDIGFTMYLVFPALYSDVSSAWRLKRWQRVIVDLGGVYFQFVVGAIFILLYFSDGTEEFKTAFLMIFYTALFSLNPVFKFDGYWVVADALGVTNLSRQPARIASYAVARFLGKPVRPLPWPVWITFVLAIYSVVSMGVWLYFMGYLLPWVARQMARYPSAVAELLQGFGRGGWMDTARHIASFAMSTLMLFAALWMFCRLIYSMTRSLFSARAKEP